LAKDIGAQVISTDDVRRRLRQVGTITGMSGDLDEGLYTAENVAAVYDEVLLYPQIYLSAGQSVILDGTWRDARQRERARTLARETSSPIVEFRCSVASDEASVRIQNRSATTSDATPQIAAALTDRNENWPEAQSIDTGRPLADSVATAQEMCHRTI
jgi:predicted kinase